MLLLFFLFHISLAYSQELIYSFELVRHGARAPMIGPGFPNTPKGQLTPMGMRQRYLLGKYNREMRVFGNYSEQLSQINMSSDWYYRTI